MDNKNDLVIRVIVLLQLLHVVGFNPLHRHEARPD